MRRKLIVLVTVLGLVFGSIHSPVLKRAQAAPMQSGNATSIEDSPVWRVQLLVSTADVWGGSALGGGGTDDWVDVRLNSENATRLNTSFNNGNDFERGKTHIYDLNPDNVRKLRDIEMIQILKPGTDAWCVRAMTLMVNGRAIYDVDFPGDGLWLSTGFMFTPYPQLRAHTLWRTYTAPPLPQAIWASELIHRIDGMVGDFIGGDALRSGWLPAPLMWRPSGDYAYSVQVTGNGQRMIHVELNLRYITNKVYNVDVQFDLEFQCGGGKLFIMTRNLDMRGYPTYDSLTASNKLIFQTFLQLSLPTRIQAAYNNITFTNDLGQTACPPIRIVGNSVYLF